MCWQINVARAEQLPSEWMWAAQQNILTHLYIIHVTSSLFKVIILSAFMLFVKLMVCKKAPKVVCVCGTGKPGKRLWGQ